MAPESPFAYLLCAFPYIVVFCLLIESSQQLLSFRRDHRCVQIRPGELFDCLK
jgi:hypothetical protein